MIKQRSYHEVMIKSWHQKGSGVKLESICLQSCESKLEKMNFITQNLSFWNQESTTVMSVVTTTISMVLGCMVMDLMMIFSACPIKFSLTLCYYKTLIECNDIMYLCI